MESQNRTQSASISQRNQIPQKLIDSAMLNYNKQQAQEKQQEIVDEINLRNKLQNFYPKNIRINKEIISKYQDQSLEKIIQNQKKIFKNQSINENYNKDYKQYDPYRDIEKQLKIPEDRKLGLTYQISTPIIIQNSQNQQLHSKSRNQSVTKKEHDQLSSTGNEKTQIQNSIQQKSFQLRLSLQNKIKASAQIGLPSMITDSSQKSKELSQYRNKLQLLTNEKQRPESQLLQRKNAFLRNKFEAQRNSMQLSSQLLNKLKKNSVIKNIESSQEATQSNFYEDSQKSKISTRLIKPKSYQNIQKDKIQQYGMSTNNIQSEQNEKYFQHNNVKEKRVIDNHLQMSETQESQAQNIKMEQIIIYEDSYCSSNQIKLSNNNNQVIKMENNNSVDSILYQSRSYNNVLKENDIEFETQKLKNSFFNFGTLTLNQRNVNTNNQIFNSQIKERKEESQSFQKNQSLLDKQLMSSKAKQNEYSIKSQTNRNARKLEKSFESINSIVQNKNYLVKEEQQASINQNQDNQNGKMKKQNNNSPRRNQKNTKLKNNSNKKLIENKNAIQNEQYILSLKVETNTKMKSPLQKTKEQKQKIDYNLLEQEITQSDFMMSKSTNTQNKMSISALDDIFNIFEQQSKNKDDIQNEKQISKLLKVDSKLKINNVSKDIRQLLYQTQRLVQNKDQVHIEVKVGEQANKIDLINDAEIFLKVYSKNQVAPIKISVQYFDNYTGQELPKIQTISLIQLYVSLNNPFPSLMNSVLQLNTPKQFEIYPSFKKSSGQIFQEEYTYLTINCISIISSDIFIKIKVRIGEDMSLNSSSKKRKLSAQRKQGQTSYSQNDGYQEIQGLDLKYFKDYINKKVIQLMDDEVKYGEFQNMIKRIKQNMIAQQLQDQIEQQNKKSVSLDRTESFALTQINDNQNANISSPSNLLAINEKNKKMVINFINKNIKKIEDRIYNQDFKDNQSCIQQQKSFLHGLEIKKKQEDIDLKNYKKKIFLLIRKEILLALKEELKKKSYDVKLLRKRAILFIRHLTFFRTIMLYRYYIQKIKDKMLKAKKQRFAVVKFIRTFKNFQKRKGQFLDFRIQQEYRQNYSFFGRVLFANDSKKSINLIYQILKNQLTQKQNVNVFKNFILKVKYLQKTYKKRYELANLRISIFHQIWTQYIQDKISSALKSKQKNAKTMLKKLSVFQKQGSNGLDYCNSLYSHQKNLYDIKVKIKRIENICLLFFQDLQEQTDFNMQKLRFIITLFKNLQKIIENAEINAGELNILIKEKQQQIKKKQGSKNPFLKKLVSLGLDENALQQFKKLSEIEKVLIQIQQKQEPDNIVENEQQIEQQLPIQELKNQSEQLMLQNLQDRFNWVVLKPQLYKLIDNLLQKFKQSSSDGKDSKLDTQKLGDDFTSNYNESDIQNQTLRSQIKITKNDQDEEQKL